jgi:hypothetical protein
LYRRIFAIRLAVPGERITIPSDRGARFNIWGMIDYNSRYHCFYSTESMTSERISDFLDKFSLTIRKDTLIVLDNAKVHRSKYTKKKRKIWEKQGLYLFFLTSYSLISTLPRLFLRMFKEQWMQPADMSRLTICSTPSIETWQC